MTRDSHMYERACSIYATRPGVVHTRVTDIAGCIRVTNIASCIRGTVSESWTQTSAGKVARVWEGGLAPSSKCRVELQIQIYCNKRRYARGLKRIVRYTQSTIMFPDKQVRDHTQTTARKKKTEKKRRGTRNVDLREYTAKPLCKTILITVQLKLPQQRCLRSRW